jgi:DHA3 family macrolide efflux protein-like MFS transporter
MIAFANGPMMAAVQASVAPEMQGRIFTLMNSGATAMTPLGLLLSGPLADAVGVRPFYLLAGGACVICGFIGLVIPAVVNIDQEGYGSKHATIPALQVEQSGETNAAHTGR